MLKFILKDIPNYFRIVFVFMVFFSFRLVAQVPTTGLVGAWEFNGNANDVSGNGNNGTVYGATLTYDRCGNPNSAYNFNGTSNYIQTLLAGPTGSVSRTVSFWARTSATSLMTAFAYGNSSGGLAYALQYNYNCGGVGVDVNNQALTRGSSCVQDNGWHHVVAILNSTVSTTLGGVIFYVDGILLSSISCVISGSTQTINTGSTYPISIGRIHDASSRFFSGDIDDVYLYNRVISTSEIQQLYTACTPPVMGSLNICSGSIVNYSILAVPGATSYSWTLPSGWSGSSSSNTIQVLSGTGIGQIKVSAINTCGGTFSAVSTVSATTNNYTVSASSNSICSGNSVSLTTNSTGSFTWLPGGSTNSMLVVSPASTTTYSLISSFQSCVSNTNALITVNPNPNLIVNSNSGTLCLGSSASVSVSGASTYSWNPISLTGSLISISPTSSAIYTVTGTTSSGCSSSATLGLNVIPNPTIIVSSSTSTLCAGSTLTLNASGGQTYTWLPVSLTGSTVIVSPLSNIVYTVIGQTNACASSTTISIYNPLNVSINSGKIDCLNNSTQCILSATSSSNAISWTGPGILGVNNLYTVTVNSAGIYTAVVTNTISGCSATQTVSVLSTIAPLNLNIVASNSFVCEPGGTIQLLVNSAANYTWFPSAIVNPSVGALVSVNPTISTTYSLIGVLGACSGSTNVTIAVKPLPQLTITASSSSVCNTKSVSLSALGAVSFTWLPMNIIGSAITIFPQSSKDYTLIGNDGFCQNTNHYSITVNPTPSISVSVSKPSICFGQTSIISANGAANYTWQPSGLSGSIISVTPMVSTIYTVNGKNSFDCISHSTISLQVKNLPNVSFESTTMSICKGESPDLKYSGAVNYTLTPNVLYPDSTTSYILIGETNFCYNSDTLTVNVNKCDTLKDLVEELFIPEGFSPNGDGINDAFVIKGLNGRQIDLVIYNRWGNEVYSKRNYDNSWVGKANIHKMVLGSENLPEGTYFYILTFQEQSDKPINGFVVIRY